MMLEHCSDYQRFAALAVRTKIHKRGDSGESAEEYIDIVIGILAIQRHSTIKAHHRMFGWARSIGESVPYSSTSPTRPATTALLPVALPYRGPMIWPFCCGQVPCRHL